VTFDRSKNHLLARWWWTVDRLMLLAIFIMIGFGLMMVATASPAIAERIGLDSFYFVKRQAIFLLLGVAVMFAVSLLPPVMIRRFGVMGFVIGLLFLLAVLVFGQEVNGAKRWLFIAGFSLQPSEFMKPFFIVFTSWVLASNGQVRADIEQFKYASLAYLLFVSLLVMQPDFGMTVVVTCVWAGQMFIAGLPFVWIGVLFFLAIAGALGAYMFLPHVAKRIDSFLQGGDGKAASYQVQKSLEAFYNGGLVGTGPGEGVIKQKLPDSHTDFIFAVIGEELGALACILLVCLVGFVVFRGLKRTHGVHDMFVVYAISGLIMQFGLQAMVNMGVALHLLPAKGMTLPFISYGGSSVLAICIAMGMILSLTRRRFGSPVPYSRRLMAT